jgi:hypothetical protein
MQRQLIHQMAVVSSDNTNESAKEWRHEVAYISLLHLRSMMAVINYETDGIPSWEMPEFDAQTRVELEKQLFLDQETRLCFAHRPYVSECDDNLRVPVRMASTFATAHCLTAPSLGPTVGSVGRTGALKYY